MSQTERQNLTRKLQHLNCQWIGFEEQAAEARMNEGGHVAAGHERTADLYRRMAEDLARKLGIE